MKKIIILLAVGAFFLSTKSEAQHFVASFGVQHHWDVPQRIHHTIAQDFYNYHWVHAKRIVRGGHVSFDVILQRGDVFIEVSLGSSGRVYGRTYFDYYPLSSHVCGSHCGYHANYYRTYKTVCSSHHHHGHNHVVYRPHVNYGYGKSYKGHGHTNKYEGNKHSAKNDNRYIVRRDRYQDSHVSRRSHRPSRDHDNRDRVRSDDGRSKSDRGRGRRSRID